MRREVLLSACLLTLGSVEGRELITPLNATQSGAPDFEAWGGAAMHENVIDSSGLSAVPDLGNYTGVSHAVASPGNSWTTEQTNGNGDYYAAANRGPDAVWTLTFAHVYSFSDLVFWGYHFGGANGNEAREFQVEFSSDGGVVFSAPITVALPLGGHTAFEPATLSFGGEFEADVVRLTITDNQWGGGAGGGDRLGVGEFRFIGEVPSRDPAISVDPAFLSVTSDGTGLPLSIEVTNVGAAMPLTITSVTPGGPDGAFLTMIDFPEVVAAGSSGQLTFEVDPGGARVGPLNAELIVASDDEIFPELVIPVTGLIRDPWASIDGPVVHGPVPKAGPTQIIPVEVRNLGSSENLQIVSAFFLDDSLGAFGVLSNFETPLLTGPGSSETIHVSFDPAGLHGGLYAATLQVLLANDPATLAELVRVVVRVDPSGETLVGWWPLDGDATDASGNGHDGIEVGSIDYEVAGATGDTGSAARFDGDSRIDVPQDEALNRSSFTFVAWANSEGGAGQFNAVVTSRFDRHSPTDNTYGFILYDSAGGSWEFWTGTTPGFDPWEVTSQGGADVTTGTWVHLALTYDAVSGEKKLYQNGGLVATDIVTNYQPNLVEDLHLGGGGDRGDRFEFEGDLDDVAVWCEALTEEDLNRIVQVGVGEFVATRRARVQLEVVGYSPLIDELRVAVSGVPGAGRSRFHLQFSTDGRTFTPLAGTTFGTDRTIVVRPISHELAPTVLIQAFAGAGP